jgi:hypothetical protein
MTRSHFLGTVLVVVIGVNMTGWALSVAFNPTTPNVHASAPVTPSAYGTQSQSASVDISQNPQNIPDSTSTIATSTESSE